MSEEELIERIARLELAVILIQPMLCKLSVLHLLEDNVDNAHEMLHSYGETYEMIETTDGRKMRYENAINSFR